MQSCRFVIVLNAGQPKPEWSLKMKRINVFAIAAALAVVFTLSFSAHAQSAPDLFKSKCVACHGADGTGSPTGKKMGAHDFTAAEVQKMSDADLTDVITNGKNKMPKYADKLKPEDVKGLVAYIRTLKK
jgi:mono/diheme cytochrome c family protein